MKTDKRVRSREADELRKAKRLEPMHKSGKERHALYSSIDDGEDDGEYRPARRESAFDYFDDEE